MGFVILFSSNKKSFPMKYRILSTEELTHLEEDFKHFLIVNGVLTEEWVRLNKEQVEKAVELVEIFSDTVLQKVYEKIAFLEFRSVDSCIVFHFSPQNIEMISIQKKPDSDTDLSSVESVHFALINKLNELNFFQSKKEFSINRELEMHEMLEKGCLLSSEEFWNSLKELMPIKNSI